MKAVDWSSIIQVSFFMVMGLIFTCLGFWGLRTFFSAPSGQELAYAEFRQLLAAKQIVSVKLSIDHRSFGCKKIDKILCKTLDGKQYIVPIFNPTLAFVDQLLDQGVTVETQVPSLFRM